VTVSFNLVEEPWIPVRDLGGGGDREVSLAEALTESHLLQRIGGDIPTQEFAITRLLLAVVRRAIDWGPDPVGRWRWLWDDGELPAADIKGYLAGVRDRFDLLHATTPFYQVADLQSASDEAKSVEVILADVPANHKHHSARTGAGLESLSLAEAARWVVHCQACDVAGIKSADVRDPRIKNNQDSRGERAASKAAGVVHWLRFLQAEDHLDPATPVRPHAYGLAYDSKGTTITAAIDDQLLMRVALLGEDSVERVVVAAAVRSTDVAVSALGALAEGLALAAGGGVSSDSRGKERVRRCDGVRDVVQADAYFLLDGRFRVWLKDLGAEPGGESDQEAVWHKTVRDIVGAQARQVIDDAGIASWTGRHVAGRWLDTPTLVDEFWRSLREALPYAYPTSPDSEEDPQ
jgi:hypothetical protein